MEDRVEFEGKIFTISTRILELDRIETDIEAEEENGRQTLYRKIEKYEHKPEKEELMKFHNKALSLLFKILQKNDNPSSESFEEEEKRQKSDSVSLESTQEKVSEDSIDNISNIENSEFEKICRESLSEKQMASFLLKNDEMYQYINNKKFAISEDLILKISTTIDFIKDNRDIEKLIGHWNLMVESNEHFNLFASMIEDNDLLIIVNDPTIPIGTMLKHNEVIKDKLIEVLYR
ncbi:hypothetical protein [Nitratifractor sp.]